MAAAEKKYRTELAPVPAWDQGEPVFNTPEVFGARPGHEIFFPVPVLGARPITFSAEGLPAGLKINPDTGVITGKTAHEQRRTVTITATNSEGTGGAEVRFHIGTTICLTPPMGWNSWNCWGKEIDAAKVRAAGEALVGSGLAAHGYTYVNIDDGWQGKRGGPFHTLQPNKKFPDMKALTARLHELGLRAGIYSTPWVTSYAGFPGGATDPKVNPNRKGLDTRDVKKQGWKFGTKSYEKEDALQWAAWGFDYLKYDWYPNDVPHTSAMAEALLESGRDIVLSLSNSAPFPHAYHWSQLANCWRTTGDISDTWESISGIGFAQDRWTPYAGPGHFNDPDMLVVGRLGWGEVRENRLTPDEQITHVTLWSLLAAPLLIGCDLTALDDFTLRLLCNDEVIAVNQDRSGFQGHCLRELRRTDETGEPVTHESVYIRPLSPGGIAVGLFNRGAAPAKIGVTWKELGLEGEKRVRDLWAQKDLGMYGNGFSLGVPAHGAQLVRIFP